MLRHVKSQKVALNSEQLFLNNIFSGHVRDVKIYFAIVRYADSNIIKKVYDTLIIKKITHLFRQPRI